MKYSTIALVVALAPATGRAAEVLVMSNQHFDAVAQDFAINTSHNLTGWDANQTPTLDELQQYEVVLLFEDGIFPNAVNIGNALAEHYENGGRIVTATFYLQDRSDAGFNGSWGALELYDPFLGTAGGCEYGPDSMDPASVVDHPITAGVNSLSANSYRGGATAKVDTTVLALWSTTNPQGLPDPLVGFRQDGDTCIVGVSVVPHAVNFPGEVAGDYYTLFDNTLAWAATCAPPGPCHNGMLDMGEECDDGNFQNGDACVGQCFLASCGDGYTQVGVEPCDDGDDPDTDDACLPGCIAASCGDGFIQAGVEGCDDGDLDNTDVCVGACQLASCGDGFIFTGFEACDDANDVAGDGCTACQLDSSESSSEGGTSTGVAESSSEGGSSETNDTGVAEFSEDTGPAESEGSTGGGGDTTTVTGASASADDSGTTGPGVTSADTDDTLTTVGSSTAGIDDTGDTGCGCTSDRSDRTPWLLLSLGALVRTRRRRA